MKAILVGIGFLMGGNCFGQLLNPAAMDKLIRENSSSLQIHINDFSEYEVSDQYISSKTGVQHIYIRQKHQDVPVLNGILNLNILQGQIFSFGDRTVKNISQLDLDFTKLILPKVALKSALRELKLPNQKIPKKLSKTTNKFQISGKEIYHPGKLAKQPIPVELFWLPQKHKNAIPIWVVELEMLNEEAFWHICIDARNGSFIQKTPLMIKCTFGDIHDNQRPEEHQINSIPIHPTGHSHLNQLADTIYHVFDLPVESPNHGTRSLVSDPWSRNGFGNQASTLGWHNDGSSTYEITRGNNVYAYEDPLNLGFGTSPFAIDYVFDFPLDFILPPDQNMSAAITNLFFWNNTIHDIFYQYGFDESAGNYQNDNLNRGGVGNDYIKAEGLDGGGLNNANFTITPDGTSGRMQMYLWSPQNIPPYGTITPDGNFDNGIIIHEYGHGISTRLTGGPSSYLCLSHNEQMGEGWSDYFALMLTTDWSIAMPTDSRGIGTYVLGETTDGVGIRTYPYTTDMTVNPMTYADVAISGGSPHYIGSVWGTMLWDFTWEIIALEGTDTDIYFGQGGNNIALQLVVEALKLQPCIPGFVDARDAILEADRLLYNGKYNCAIWKAFARRGLGVSASQGFSYFFSDGTEAFDEPDFIKIQQIPIADTIYEKKSILLSYQVTCECQDHLDVDIKIKPSADLLYVPNSGGNFFNDTVYFEQIDILCGDTTILSFEVEADCFSSYDSVEILSDDVEGDPFFESKVIEGSMINWIPTNSLFHSENTSWYAQDLSFPNVSVIELVDSILIRGNTYLSFMHRYETEYFWDGGFIQYSLDGDTIWNDLEDFFILNGYPQGRGFTGNSDNYFGPGFDRSIVDLSSFIGSAVRIRFLFYCDITVGGPGLNGWYIDDVKVFEESGAATRSIISHDDTTYTVFHQHFKIDVSGDHIYVDLSSSESQDGSDWQHAFVDLQDALASAECNDTIYIAEGSYLPTDSVGRDSVFQLRSGIALLGGFPQGGGTLLERDPVMYPSILSGNIGNLDSTNDNSFHVIQVDSSQHSIYLDGLDIAFASADSTGIHSKGAAIMNAGQLVLKHVFIHDIEGLKQGFLIYNHGSKAQLILDEVNIELLINPTNNDPILNANEAYLIIKSAVDINR